MSRNVRIAIVVAVVVLALVELFVPEGDQEAARPTTRGTMPWGYRAAHDMLVELGFPIVRHHEPLERLPASGTAWWIGPNDLCDDDDAEPQDPTARPWVEGGGTAVVFLPESYPATRPCMIAGLAVPLPGAPRDEPCVDSIEGMGTPRALKIRTLHTFADAGDWIARATLGNRPFVLEHALGSGRLVLVADVRPLQNVHLADGDAAPLVVDLVRSFGVPSIVEDAPDLAAARSPSAVAYLARSPAAALLAGLIVTGLLLAWRGALVPPRTIGEDALPAPTLQTFVDSLARLYAGTHDHARVLARYRQLSVSRLRRHLGLPAYTPVESIVDRIGRARSPGDEARALLLDPLAVTTASELRAAVGRMDALVGQVIG
jgi:hypothetical protein